MSFLDTLKNLGLWQGQQPQAAQPNPYGLDPQMMQMARSQALGNIGGQILAMSQQMTPDQRARMMAGADWTGGYQNSLYNAAQMQLMSDAQRRRKLEMERAEDARTSIAEMIRRTPPGRLRDAAMYFFQAGDYGKAGELLFKQERRFNPMTATYETIDAFGQPIGAAASPMPSQPATGGTPLPSVAPAPGPAAIPQPDGTSVMPPPEANVDGVTMRWRALTRDPSLTPQEVQQMVMAAEAEGNPDAAMKVYRDLVKQRTDNLNKDEDQAQTLKTSNINAAEKLRTDYDTAGKAYNTVIGAAEYAATIAQQPNMSPAEKLAVLYNYIKTLDPLGAVRDSDVELAQSIQPVTNQLEQIFKRFNEGGTISDAAILQIARAMAGLGNDAKGRLGRKEQEIRRVAVARGVNPNMIFGEPMRGPQGPQAPIGSRIPKAPLAQEDQPLGIEMAPNEKGFFDTYFGGQ